MLAGARRARRGAAEERQDDAMSVGGGTWLIINFHKRASQLLKGAAR